MGIAWRSPIKGSSTQGFTRILDRQLSENGLKGEWFWKLETSIQVKWYISQLRASKTTVSFGNKAWSEDLVFKTQRFLSLREIRLDCITNFLADNSRKSSYFSQTNSILFSKAKCFKEVNISFTGYSIQQHDTVEYLWMPTWL